jgi:plasmid replication initiation protein
MILETPERKRTVTQDNALIMASYAMTLDEKRLLVAAISKLDPTSKAWLAGRAEAEVTASEWMRLYSADQTNAYRQINEASKRLYDRSARVWGDSKKGKEVRWISGREYDEGQGRVVLIFGGPILHYLTGMVDEFTKYDLLGVCGLKSVHSVRLYELASQFKGTGWRHIELDDLRGMFGLGDAYQDWRDLKKRVIDRACKEVTAKSDLDVSYEIVKRGRSVHAIRLKIESKEQLDLF